MGSSGRSAKLTLSRAHRQQLDESAIRPDVRRARRYRSVHHPEKLQRLGFSQAQGQLVPALLVPVWDVYGDNTRYQLRPDTPRPDSSGKLRKYENVPKTPVTIDVNPLTLDGVMDWRTPLWITEGIKKEDALVSAGVAAIGLYGVWNWRGTDESGAISRLPAWDEMPLKGKARGGEERGRQVFVVFDSDVMQKRSVNLALVRLGRFLGGRGADVRYVYLPAEGDAKVGVDDYLFTGGVVEDLAELAVDEPRGLPSVVVNNRQLRDITSQVVDILDEANDPAQLFRWGTVLTRTRVDERDRPITEPFDRDRMTHHMTAVADFEKTKTVQGRTIRLPAFPPDKVATNILASPEWPFPVLNGIVENPTLRPDGSVIDHPGYDAQTGLVYIPAPDFTMAPAPEEPTKKERTDALKRILYMLHDFPFVSEADLANMVGLLLTPIVRPAIDGAVPLCGLSAPTQGSGKTLLGELVSRIATGRAADAQAIPADDREWPKTLIAILRESPAVVLFDNVMRVERSGELAKAVSGKSYAGRILGVSDMAELPVRTTWVMSGNNLRFAGDLPRRVYPVNIDPQMAKPWKRKQDEWLESDLGAWVLDHRGELVWSLLVLARSWWAAGRPDGGTPVIGGFESWSRVIGGILAHAGDYRLPEDRFDKRLSGKAFLGNLDQLYEDSDVETRTWGPFYALWLRHLGPGHVRCGDVYEALLGDQDFRETLPSELVEGFGRGQESFARGLGRHLAYRRGKFYECDGREYAINPAKNRKTKANEWAVVPRSPSE